MPPGVAAVTGRAAIKAFLGEDAAKTKAAGISIKTRRGRGAAGRGERGWVSGTYTGVDGSGATIDSGNYLSVHRRTNGAWRYTRDIWNPTRPPPAAPAPAAPAP